MASQVYLKIEDLHVEVEGNEILKGLSLEIKGGEVHALMGPNGSGKSTLAYALAGHRVDEVTSGRVDLNGQDLLEMEPDERSRAGLFLCFQYPSEISGVSVANFLRTASTPAGRKATRSLWPSSARSCANKWSGSRWIPHSPAVISTRASPGARRSAARSYDGPLGAQHRHLG